MIGRFVSWGCVRAAGALAAIYRHITKNLKAGVGYNFVPCWFWSDAPTVPAYSAADCEEGRACLAKLREVSATKRFPGSKEEEARRTELQKQKMQIVSAREPGEEG